MLLLVCEMVAGFVAKVLLHLSFNFRSTVSDYLIQVFVNLSADRIMILRRITAAFPSSRRLFSSNGNYDVASTIAEINKVCHCFSFR